jgi:hypothetical protein
MWALWAHIILVLSAWLSPAVSGLRNWVIQFSLDIMCYLAPNAYIYPPGPAWLLVEPFSSMLQKCELFPDSIPTWFSGIFSVMGFLLMDRRLWSVLVATRLHLPRHLKVRSSTANCHRQRTSDWIWRTLVAGDYLIWEVVAYAGVVYMYIPSLGKLGCLCYTKKCNWYSEVRLSDLWTLEW